jgi:hypothetical protein
VFSAGVFSAGVFSEGDLEMRLGFVIALAAGIAMTFSASGCGGRKEMAASNLASAKASSADDAPRPETFTLSADEAGGGDLPEREEIRRIWKLTPANGGYIINGDDDVRLHAAGTHVFIKGVSGKVKVETGDTDAVEVLVVRSARARADLSRQKVEFGKGEDHLIRFRQDRSSDPMPEIRQRLILRMPRKTGLEIQDIEGDVSIGEVDGWLNVFQVEGGARISRAAGPVAVGNVNGNVEIAFAPARANSVWVGDVNGGVDLRFEGELNANLKASSINGVIKPDFPRIETRNAESEPGKYEGRIGAGGVDINVNNVNGNLTMTGAAK